MSLLRLKKKNLLLKRMRRPYTPAQYLEKVAALRQALPEPALSTDLMVGFPGEDDRAFQQSLEVLKAARVSRVHVFPYSPRTGTEAAAWRGVSDGVKTERVRRAQGIAASLKQAFDRVCLGREEQILVETLTDRAATLPTGLTSRYQKTAVQGSDAGLGAGNFATVRLETYQDGMFLGSLLKAVSS